MRTSRITATGVIRRTRISRTLISNSRTAGIPIISRTAIRRARISSTTGIRTVTDTAIPDKVIPGTADTAVTEATADTAIPDTVIPDTAVTEVSEVTVVTEVIPK